MSTRDAVSMDLLNAGRLDGHYYQRARAGLGRACGKEPGGGMAAGVDVILFSALALEYFINSEYQRLAELIGDDVRPVLSENHRKFHGGKEKVRASDLTLRGKWRYLPLLLGGDGFDEDAPLFRDFAELVIIYDHRLLGGKPGKKSYLEGSRGITAPLPVLLGDVDWLARCVQIVPELILALHRVSRGKTAQPGWAAAAGGS